MAIPNLNQRGTQITDLSVMIAGAPLITKMGDPVDIQWVLGCSNFKYTNNDQNILNS